jgi:hypothetical protein
LSSVTSTSPFPCFMASAAATFMLLLTKPFAFLAPHGSVSSP